MTSFVVVTNASRMFGLLVALAACAPLGAGLEPAPAGRVRFYNIADSDFDRYSHSPSRADQKWMRDHYARMQTYSPYFDRRLRWYPLAWVYKDSYAIKPHWEVYRTNPEWVLRDADGRELYIPWGCRDGRCPQFAADVGNPAFRAHWIAEAAKLVETGYRGIWVDDVNLTWRVSDGHGRHVRPIDPRTGTEMRLDDWRENFAVFMEEIRAAFPDIEIAHNSIWYAGPFDEPAILRQIDAADYINLERGATDPGLTGGDGKWSFDRFLGFIDLVQDRDRAVILMDYGDTPREREFALAAWLLISSGRDLLSSNQLDWTAPVSFWGGYKTDFGPARGTRYEWRGLLRRDFECGYALLNPPDARAISLALPSGQRRIDGQPARGITLAESQAAVISLDCAARTMSTVGFEPEKARPNADMFRAEYPHP
ncbi:MAG: putative glycoside hydrolase [Gammaproteobacteria bacterium]|nr:putative glycoside hydrolase [Gammaproteobacteria bacterium]